MNNLSIKGIVIGFLLSLGLDIVFGLLAVPLFAKGTSQEALQAMTQDTRMLIYSLVLGLATTVLGAYVAARFGKLAPYKNGAGVGVLGILLGLLLHTDYPAWFNVVAYGLTIPAALLGGYLVATRK